MIIRRFIFLTGLMAAGTACHLIEPYHPTRDDARQASQQIVKKQLLLSPGHLMFASAIETSVDELSPNRFRVRSFIDYRGASGLPIRTNYNCVLHCRGKGQWILEDLKLE